MSYLTEEELERCPIGDYMVDVHRFAPCPVEVPGLEALDSAAVFLQGACQLFAFALKTEFGYGVYVIRQNTYFHIFCKSEDNRFYIDVRGKTDSLNVFLEALRLVDGQDFEITPYQFQEDDFNDNQHFGTAIGFAMAIINRNKSRYQA